MAAILFDVEPFMSLPPRHPAPDVPPTAHRIRIDTPSNEGLRLHDVPAGTALGVRELCHDLQQEVTVLDLLLCRLTDARAADAVERALHAQVAVLRDTLRETQLPPTPTELNLRPLIAEAVATTRLVHLGTIALHASGCGLVRGIASEVRRGVMNLLDNARRAAPRGTIHVRLADIDEDVLLEVEDDGSGSAPACGWGIGTAIVAEVARRHGGTVTQRSSDLGGLAVGIRIPRLVTTT
jgi:signal transduction histidine kinase